jgi:hypothetical protein
MVPSLETLERLSAALDLPLYRLFYMPEEEFSTESIGTPGKSLAELAEDGGPTGSEARFLLRLKGYVENMGESDRILLLDFAKKLAGR